MKKGISVEHLYSSKDKFIGYTVKKRRGQLTIQEVLDAIRETDDGATLGIIINPFASDEPQGIDWSMGAEDAGDRADCVFLYELEEWTKDNW